MIEIQNTTATANTKIVNMIIELARPFSVYLYEDNNKCQYSKFFINYNIGGYSWKRTIDKIIETIPNENNYLTSQVDKINWDQTNKTLTLFHDNYTYIVNFGQCVTEINAPHKIDLSSSK